RMRPVLIVLGLILISVAPARQQTTPADLILKNGAVYTANDQAPTAQAVAVKGDRIVFVGSNAEAQKYAGKDTRLVDLQGKTVLPGFTDSHQHLSGVYKP